MDDIVTVTHTHTHTKYVCGQVVVTLCLVILDVYDCYYWKTRNTVAFLVYPCTTRKFSTSSVWMKRPNCSGEIRFFNGPLCSKVEGLTLMWLRSNWDLTREYINTWLPSAGRSRVPAHQLRYEFIVVITNWPVSSIDADGLYETQRIQLRHGMRTSGFSFPHTCTHTNCLTNTHIVCNVLPYL